MKKYQMLLGHPSSAERRACEPGTWVEWNILRARKPATKPVLLLMPRAVRRSARWGDWAGERFRTFRLVTAPGRLRPDRRSRWDG